VGTTEIAAERAPGGPRCGDTQDDYTPSSHRALLSLN
jgi:hypothetical protein